MEHLQLSPALGQQIVAGIRAGAYPHVAAEARGVSRQRFQRWLRLGRGRRAREPFASFAIEVRSAVAQARIRAEAHMLDNDPKAWLQHGPGRESPGNPGWSGPVKAIEPTEAQEPNPFLNAGFMARCRNVHDALKERYPEAAAIAAEVFGLSKKESSTQKGPSHDSPHALLPEATPHDRAGTEDHPSS
jgi:hypothetical protein